MGQVNKRARACNIPRRVKAAVWERDGGECVICHSSNAAPNAHLIRRSRGGLGVEQNILTLCGKCHDKYDSGRQDETDELYCWLKAYLMSQYPGWNEKRLVYNKFAYMDESALDIWPKGD